MYRHIRSKLPQRTWPHRIGLGQKVLQKWLLLWAGQILHAPGRRRRAGCLGHSFNILVAQLDNILMGARPAYVTYVSRTGPRNLLRHKVRKRGTWIPTHQSGVWALVCVPPKQDPVYLIIGRLFRSHVHNFIKGCVFKGGCVGKPISANSLIPDEGEESYQVNVNSVSKHSALVYRRLLLWENRTPPIKIVIFWVLH